MTPAETIVISLVVLFGLVLGSGIMLVLLAVRCRRQLGAAKSGNYTGRNDTSFPACRRATILDAPRPACWLAIKSRDPLAVQAALTLTNPKLCAWSDELATRQQLFIAPPVHGWTLVMGDGLPLPNDDVDVCFRFLLALSRQLGHVQFFQTDRVLHHHAWARVEAGRVVRAYAWAGETLWNQGVKTATESALGMKCFAYGETVSPAAWGENDVVATNVARISLLAAHWSLNPSAIDPQFWERRHGIAGRISSHY